MHRLLSAGEYHPQLYQKHYCSKHLNALCKLTPGVPEYAGLFNFPLSFFKRGATLRHLDVFSIFGVS